MTVEEGVVISVSNDDFLVFVDHALDEMVAILGELGDDLANRRPELPGANSPYAILTHCLGVMEFWGGSMIAGREIERDRDAEFRAHGPVAELAARTVDARRRLEGDISNVDPTARPRNPPDPGFADLPFGRNQGGVLLHILEELTQHLGQMELTRDILVAKMGP